MGMEFCNIYYMDLIGFDFGLFEQSTTSKKKDHPSLHQYEITSLASCLNNLKYPPCPISNHDSEPLSMVCIDQKCPDRTLICALCESYRHYKHNCVPLKYYLNEVYGHLYGERDRLEESSPLPVMEVESVSGPKSKNKKNRNKTKPPIFPQSPPATNSRVKSALFYTSRIEQRKRQFLNSISEYRQEILDRLHSFETIAIQYFNKVVSEASMLIAFQNPIQNLQMMMDNLQSFRTAAMDCQNEKEALKYRGQERQESMRLKGFVANILKMTKIKQKFDLPEKLEAIWLKTNQIAKQISKQMGQIHTQYDTQISKFEAQLATQLKIEIANLEIQKVSPFKFSEKLKGHKFVVKNEGKMAEQTGMESSGQRFMLLEPCLPKNNKIGTLKTQTWGIRIIKIVGWVGLGISLKKAITDAKYAFNYSNIGHGSYLISANGYSWSHSVKEFNSASKSFSFATGDIIYFQYNIAEKKLVFYKNNNEVKFQLDIVDPPQHDEYCPSVNMCSSGDTVQVINQKPAFL